MRIRHVSVTLALTAAVLVMLVIPLLAPRAASAYASPAFEMRWKTDEAVQPNFYGPLNLAKDGQQEAYVDAPGGMRLVQYFDKARMELGASGTVTSGLLATELVMGKLQLGDTSFKACTPPAIPIAGDPNGPGPKYADFTGKAAPVLMPGTSAVGKSVSVVLAPDGTPSTGTPSGDATPYAISVFDDVTKHNVPAAFADLRTRVNLNTVGYAISEPFLLNVGMPNGAAMAQIFQRRVMTYTPANADPFKVEFGNIGQHYYQWRSGCGSATATGAMSTGTAMSTAAMTATSGTPPAASATPGTMTAGAAATATPPKTPSATTGPIGTTIMVTFKSTTSPVQHGMNATTNVTTSPGASCLITVADKNGPSAAQGLTSKTADSAGAVSWTWKASDTAGSYPIDVACSSGTNTGLARTTIMVT